MCKVSAVPSAHLCLRIATSHSFLKDTPRICRGNEEKMKSEQDDKTKARSISRQRGKRLEENHESRGGGDGRASERNCNGRFIFSSAGYRGGIERETHGVLGIKTIGAGTERRAIGYAKLRRANRQAISAARRRCAITPREERWTAIFQELSAVDKRREIIT